MKRPSFHVHRTDPDRPLTIPQVVEILRAEVVTEYETPRVLNEHRLSSCRATEIPIRKGI